MSGHSKWSTIKHAKAAEDKKRGKVFSKLAKAITVAAREGGGEVESNAKLRVAIDQAKSMNMPKANIDRAIQRGSGTGEGGGLETVTYEGFGPEKTAVVVECVTDNRNRTGAEIKSFFESHGGNLGAPGSANYMFEKKGTIIVKKKGDGEEQVLELIDLGVDDVSEEEELLEVYTKPQELEAIKKKVEEKGYEIKEASLGLKAKTMAPVKEEKQKERVLKFLTELDEMDDVQNVYCNADMVD